MSAPLILSAKVMRRIVRLAGGHGSALPGLIIERVDKNFLRRTLRRLPLGVIVVTGTNGKTTTTSMIVHMLRSQQLRVLTNESGSNLTRGLISTVVERASRTGRLAFDIAVLEIDEANAPLFSAQISPNLLVALNVMRDQLDRYGEIDTTAQLIAQAAGRADKVVVNAADPLLMGKTDSHPSRTTFALAPALRQSVSSEANLYSNDPRAIKNEAKTECVDAEIVDIKTTKDGLHATGRILKETVEFSLPLKGSHNALNAFAAIITTNIILPKTPLRNLTASLASFSPVFGRGETLELDGRKITVALIKNPSGFTQNMRTFVAADVDAIVIIINDAYADGRDVSWLWDSHIDQLRDFKGRIFVAGTRRYDMAIRLKYEHIPYQVIDDHTPQKIMMHVNRHKWKRLLVVPTYTAMLAFRKWLAQAQGERHIW